MSRVSDQTPFYRLTVFFVFQHVLVQLQPRGLWFFSAFHSGLHRSTLMSASICHARGKGLDEGGRGWGEVSGLGLLYFQWYDERTMTSNNEGLSASVKLRLHYASQNRPGSKNGLKRNDCIFRIDMCWLRRTSHKILSCSSRLSASKRAILYRFSVTLQRIQDFELKVGTRNSLLPAQTQNL